MTNGDYVDTTRRPASHPRLEDSHASEYDAALRQAFERARRYVIDIGERRVGVQGEAIERMSALGGPLPQVGEHTTSIIALLDEAGSPATMASMGGRFFGGVIGGALPATVAAHWLADAWNQNACLFDFSPVSAYLEEVVIGWLVELLQLPRASAGALVTGTQMADVTALAAARCAVLALTGWNVEADGLFGAPPVTVIVGEEVHATMLKALALLGFGRQRLCVVPADAQGRLNPAKIPRLHGPTIVCAQIGNVNTGACDPVSDICHVAHDAGAWVHIDGAFGLWAAASEAKRHLVAGVEDADSWATDAHKWLNVPQDCGIALVREPEYLRRAMAIDASYYPEPSGRREPMHWCPESSRRARAVELWAGLRSLGSNGIANLIDTTCSHAARFADGFRAAGWEILNDVQLNQVLVSFGDDERTERVIRAIQEEGTCWCGGTVWRGRRAMRISVSSWATTVDDVTRSLRAMLGLAEQFRP